MRRHLLTTIGTTRSTPRALAALALAGALVLGACSTGDAGTGSDAGATSAPDPASSSSPGGAGATEGDAAGATVDTDALPDPVAEVNGQPVSRADFVEVFEQQRAASQQAPEGGGAMAEVALRDAVLESLVSNELLAQEAERLDLRASDADVDKELDSIAEQSGVGSAEEFLTLLEEQGVDEEQVREEAARLVLVGRVVEERGEVEPPTEKELRAYYEELTAGPDGAASTGGDGVPAFEDVEDILADQLSQERENEAITTILGDLEAKAEITRHL